MPRLQPLVVLASLVPLFMLACASSQAASPVTPETEAPQDFPSATAFVQHLASLAAVGDDASLDAATDHAFADRLSSREALGPMLRAVPLGCEPALSESPGYAAIAIPPPMVDDSAEDAARTEALIEALRATTEVQATCAVTEGEGNEDGEDRVTIALYTIAVRRTEAGWRALAWRDHRFD